MQNQRIKFPKGTKEGFYFTLRKRVNQYFRENNLSKNANRAVIGKTIFILSVWLLSYGLLLSNLFEPWVLLILAIINGFFTALIGLNIAHDAIHGSYSKNKKVNRWLGTIFNIVGANDYMWKISHNVVHHTYTNIPDHDGDIDQVPIIRLNPNQDLWWIHRFQHIYTFFLYPLSTISWVFLKDYKTFFQDRIGGYDNSQKPRKELVRMIFFKIIYYTLYLVIPLTVIALPWYYILLGFVVLHLVEGMTLAITFQLAHIVEETAFPEPGPDGKMAHSWAELQLYTSADFACSNKVVNFLTGGLNFQVEHHLFPDVCHIHYTKLAPIVEQTAREYNLPYYSYGTFTGAIRSHVKTLKRFGTQKEVTPNIAGR